MLGSYGDESLPLPEIAGGGNYEAILIRNVQYWELQDLRITNKGEAPRPKIAGIRIEADNIEGGVMNHIHIRRCEIADVYGTKTHHNEGGGSGIFYYNVIGGSNPSSFHDLVVEDCRLTDCQRDGLTGYLSTGDRSLRKANTGFVFRRNVFEGIPGDQIIVNGCDDALVEYNVVRNCAPGDFADESVPNRMEAAQPCGASTATARSPATTPCRTTRPRGTDRRSTLIRTAATRSSSTTSPTTTRAAG